jgi:hypothetical protein
MYSAIWDVFTFVMGTFFSMRSVSNPRFRGSSVSTFLSPIARVTQNYKQMGFVKKIVASCKAGLNWSCMKSGQSSKTGHIQRVNGSRGSNLRASISHSYPERHFKEVLQAGSQFAALG